MAGLYIDHGWDMGWCLRAARGFASGVFNSRKGNPVDGARLLAQSDWFTGVLRRLTGAGEQLEEIAYEQITFVGQNDADTLHAHGKQLGNLQRWAFLKGQPEPRGIAWNVGKKHITGHGSASRTKMLDTVQAVLPSVTDHNQASAVAVMLTATNQKLSNPRAPPHAGYSESAPG